MDIAYLSSQVKQILVSMKQYFVAKKVICTVYHLSTDDPSAVRSFQTIKTTMLPSTSLAYSVSICQNITGTNVRCFGDMNAHPLL